MKKDAVILNFARNGLVDEDALVAALDNGKLAHYVTDFPTPKVAGVKGVIAFPHLGASTEEHRTGRKSYRGGTIPLQS